MAARRIVPLLDRVLVKRVLAEEKTAGGVFLPESAQKKLREGVIMAVGPKAVGSVQAGDRIVLPEYGAGERVEMEKEEYLIMKNEDILAKIEDQ